MYTIGISARSSNSGRSLAQQRESSLSFISFLGRNDNQIICLQFKLKSRNLWILGGYFFLVVKRIMFC